jgi:Superfamily II DNA/RNA helicases, SNF2 family
MRLRENVIISLDLAKRDEHLARLIEAGRWDVIVFDEAHRLGRAESGEQTERYILARRLRDRTHSLLLLTATPHQGKSRRFAALLELVRPDLIPQIQTLEMNPELVGDIIIRNKKSRVTDAEGRLIFRGHDTIRYKVRPSDSMKAADQALRNYLTAGYRASFNVQDRTLGRAIGFVMTTYRKLASSSVAAIERALERRLERLENSAAASTLVLPSDDELEGDDLLAETGPIDQMIAFFEDEATEVRSVLKQIRLAKQEDVKLTTFLRDVLTPLMANDQSLLIFTEYRATQDYLARAITQTFPDIEVVTINGSMSLDQKTNNVREFNSRRARVLISTEAGGEGLNLQDACHVMVNYDLPWNPARLVQRIGRLYRYGQQKRVQVINLQADDGFDSSALSLMLDRVVTIANDMAAVAGDKSEALATEILGELMSHIDMESILERATTMKIEQTEEEIAEAIRMAQEARAAEDDILQFASAQETRVSGGFNAHHMVSFVKGMADIAGIEVRNVLHDGRTLELSLPEGAVGQWPEFGRRSIVRLTADHAKAVEDPTMVPMDFEGSFVRHLADVAGDRRNFDGLYGEAETMSDHKHVAVHQVRWQGMSGELLEEELIALSAQEGVMREMPHEDFSKLLLHPLQSCEPSSATDNHRQVAKELAASIDRVLARRLANGRMPTSVFVTAAIQLTGSE